MVSDQELEESFEELSVKVEDIAILDKCEWKQFELMSMTMCRCSLAGLIFRLLSVKEICQIHRLGANDIVDEWVAFTTTNGLDIEPTLEHLDRFERKVKSKER